MQIPDDHSKIRWSRKYQMTTQISHDHLNIRWWVFKMRTQVRGQGNAPTTCPTSPQVEARKLFLLSEYYWSCDHTKDHWIVLCSIEDKLCKGDSVGNNCWARVHENPGRRLLCACCSQQQGFYLFKIFILMGKFLDFFSSGFGQWLRIARWCVESWWEHIHHRHREGIWNIHNDLLAKVFKRFLSPMMTTWLPPLPNDHVHPALWVSSRRHKLSSLFGLSFRKRENT